MSQSNTIEFKGGQYYDDRLFVLYLCKGKVETTPDNDGIIWTTIYHEDVPNEHIWCVVTYRNCVGYPIAGVKHFTSRDRAVVYMWHIEPETPLISLNGLSPLPVPSYQDYLAWKKKNNLREFDFKTVFTPGGTNAEESIAQAKEQFKGMDIKV
ncbi:MAG: hypothetical protein EXS68_01470 [Candidatus Ryanbacteria bacterium]|nr:hypothetical protein [Candidatus Ryanbacteria bacterium]